MNNQLSRQSQSPSWLPRRPPLIATKLTKVTTDHPKRREATEQWVPVKRLGQPEDIAGTALFLASPLSAYIVGQTIVVDGGLTLA